MNDLEYQTSGMFTRFVSNTPAGEDAWRVMAESGNCGAVLTIHLQSVLRQIRKAGLTVSKAKPPTSNIDDIFAELESA